MKNGIARFLGVSTGIGTAILLSVTAAFAANADSTVTLTMGKADTVSFSRPVADILVADPAIADVGALRADKLYIVGKAIGDTNVLTFDDVGNQMADIAVHVHVDDKTLKSTMANFFPDEDIEIKTVNNDVILSGKVSTPAIANQVRDMAARFVKVAGKTVVDLMTVQGEQQVMLKVKVIEAKRSILREYGIATDFVGGAIGGASNSNINSVEGSGLQSLIPFATGQLFVEKSGELGPIRVDLEGMEKDGLINTLAEPNLTAISGETAGFLAGGEFPVPTGRDSNGNITLEFKKFGVALNFTPTVMSSDRIALQLSTEVSAKSDADSVTLVNTIIPGLTVRRAETTVQMASGGTLMIAGLIKSDTLHNVTGFPGIQDVPILGDLFKSKSFTRGETELVILVSPYIVQPFARPAAERVTNKDGMLPVLPTGTLRPAANNKLSKKLSPPPLPVMEQAVASAHLSQGTLEQAVIFWNEEDVPPPPSPKRKPAVAPARVPVSSLMDHKKEVALPQRKPGAVSLLTTAPIVKTEPLPTADKLPSATVLPVQAVVLSQPVAATAIETQKSGARAFKPSTVMIYNEG